MRKYTVRTYTPEYYHAWNEFVAKAKNATFLFHRDFMEYHQDKFQDFSLVVTDENDNIKAILPANRVKDTLFSHQGLTYGGIVVEAFERLPDFVQIVRSILHFLNSNNISCLTIKQLPNIYFKQAANELNYLFFLLQAKLIRRDVLSVIDLSQKLVFSRDRKFGVKKGIRNNLIVKEENNFETFWKTILEPNLLKKHSTKPVHSLEEITLLNKKFPSNIRHFNVYFNDEVVAGTTIFETEKVAHSQYISANENKNQLGSLDFLHDFLLKNVFNNKSFFDFGISNENQGKNINEGLLYWKESFGATSITQDFYEIETKNYSLLEGVFI